MKKTGYGTRYADTRLLDKKLARSVQDTVVERRGGKPPSYLYCLNLVRNAFRETPEGLRTREWQEKLVDSLAAKTR